MENGDFVFDETIPGQEFENQKIELKKEIAISENKGNQKNRETLFYGFSLFILFFEIHGYFSPNILISFLGLSLFAYFLFTKKNTFFAYSYLVLVLINVFFYTDILGSFARFLIIEKLLFPEFSFPTFWKIYIWNFAVYASIIGFYSVISPFSWTGINVYLTHEEDYNLIFEKNDQILLLNLLEKAFSLFLWFFLIFITLFIFILHDEKLFRRISLTLPLTIENFMKKNPQLVFQALEQSATIGFALANKNGLGNSDKASVPPPKTEDQKDFQIMKILNFDQFLIYNPIYVDPMKKMIIKIGSTILNTPPGYRRIFYPSDTQETITVEVDGYCRSYIDNELVDTFEIAKEILEEKFIPSEPLEKISIEIPNEEISFLDE